MHDYTEGAGRCVWKVGEEGEGGSAAVGRSERRLQSAAYGRHQTVLLELCGAGAQALIDIGWDTARGGTPHLTGECCAE